tara:strand:+ start:533 stop:1609 length:1077 start_codon:yes stop_codon:yes gene_type:complete
MKVAVVGGGIFGVTAAFKLAEHYKVDLFEKNDDLLKAASDVHHCRIHLGYHYPRSDVTVSEVSRAQNSFNKEFSDAIINDTENYYCISKRNSLITAEEYIEFCERHGLEFTKSSLDIIDNEQIDLCVKVKEKLYDYEKLKEICWKKLNKNNVNVLLKKEATQEILENYDFRVLCIYADFNKLLESFPESQQDFQYEVCEKVFVKLPPSFNNKSILILDGPFTSIDPVGTTGLFILGNVVHTVHQTNIGKYPYVDSKFLSLLNRGIIKDPPITNYELFIQSAAKFIPEIKKAKHFGSSFCIKAVLPYEQKTDTRPTLVNIVNDRTFTVFSGKIPTCVEVANNVIRLIEKSVKEDNYHSA